MHRNSLIFWAIRFVPEARRVGRRSTSSTSVRPFLRKPARPYGGRFETGSCTYVVRRRGFIPSGSTSTACSPGGRRGNTKSCDTVFGEQSSGSGVSLSAIHGSLLTGSCVRRVALQWEPYELRGSCPVLRERGGTIPPATLRGVDRLFTRHCSRTTTAICITITFAPRDRGFLHLIRNPCPR
jgi:hypothetical protein